jgi:hypothetical protein
MLGRIDFTVPRSVKIAARRLLKVGPDSPVLCALVDEMQARPEIVRGAVRYDGAISSWADKLIQLMDEPVDPLAHQAASSPYNRLTPPTDGQKEAGNYKKGHVKIAGLDISIELPQYSTRSGVTQDGTEWSVTMQAHYGYIRKTAAADSEHIDIFIKPGTDTEYAGPVYIIDQVRPDGSFDEHKILLGWGDAESAKTGYLSNYSAGWDGLGEITELTDVAALKEWLSTADLSKPAKGRGQGGTTAAAQVVSDQGIAGAGSARDGLSGSKEAVMADEIKLAIEGEDPIEDAVMKAADRNKLRVGQFAVPGKKKLPIHDAEHVRNAWSRLNQTKGLTDAEKKTARRRIIAAAKRFKIKLDTTKVATGKAKAVKDASADIPADMSVYEFMQALEEELRETQPQYCVCDCYPGGDAPFLVARMKVVRRNTWDESLYESLSDEKYKIPYTITDTNDADGDIDEVNVTFGEASEIRMVPKEIGGEDDGSMSDESGAEEAKRIAAAAAVGVIFDSAAGPLFFDDFAPTEAIVLSDAAERKSGKLRIRVKGPRGNVINANNRVYPTPLLEAAVKKAQAKARTTGLLAYNPHPPSYEAADGSIQFKTETDKSAGLITDWSIDGHGQTYVDYTLFERTTAGQQLRERVDLKAPIGTSLRALGATVMADYGGRKCQVAKTLEIVSNDFVDNPALASAMGQAVVLTDAAIEAMLKEVPAPEGASATAQNAGNSTEEHQTAMTDKVDPKPASAAADDKTTAAAADPTKQPVLDAATQQKLAMLDDPRFKALLDEHDERDRAGKVKAFLDDAIGGKPVKLSADGKEEALDLSRFSEKQIATIVDNCKDASPENVGERLQLAMSMADSFNADAKLYGMGYRSNGGGIGKTVDNGGVQIFVDAPQGYKEHVDKLSAAMDGAWKKINGAPMVDPALRAANQPFVDAVLGGYMRREDQARAMADAAERFLTDDASLATLLQQPTIAPATAALIQQAYWLLSWLPICGGIGPEGFNAGPGNDLGVGENLRIPVQTRGSGRAPFGKLENAALTQVNTLLRWLNFAPSWRGIGFRLTKEAEVQLAKGSARYEALGHQLAAIAAIIAESVDIDIAHEHISASDEYQSVQVGTLSVATWTNGEVHVNGDMITTAGTLTAMGYNQAAVGASSGFVGTNEQAVASAVKIAQTFVVGNNTYQRPIVPTRHVRVVQTDGSISNTTDTFTNPINATVGGGNALIRGLINEAGNIIDDPTGTAGAQYAVDYENGVFVFSAFAVSGVDGTHPPTIGYAYATNFDTFDVSGSAAATDPHLFYDGLLGQIRATAAQMGSAPRFAPPDMIVSDLNAAAFIQDARSAINLFAAKGVDVSIADPNPSEYGTMGKMGLSQVNTPWRVGSGRILIGRRRATKYAVQFPYTVEGPVPDYILVNNKPTPTGNKNWTAQENSIFCTPVAFDVVSGATVYRNHPYRTIKVVGQASAVY